MIAGFRALNAEEINLLTEAPALITILVGGADGELDQEERSWSEKLLRARTYNKSHELHAFYRIVAERLWVQIHHLMSELPRSPKARNKVISARLEKLNPILAKLELKLAADLYKGFVGLAEETAKSSGGFLRLGAIGPHEAEWVHLPMLAPVVGPEEEEEWEEDEN